MDGEVTIRDLPTTRMPRSSSTARNTESVKVAGSGTVSCRHTSRPPRWMVPVTRTGSLGSAREMKVRDRPVAVTASFTTSRPALSGMV